MNGRSCYQCKRPGGVGKRELRPYGPNGSDICAGCVFGEEGSEANQELLGQARSQLQRQLGNAGESVIVLDAANQVGPRALTPQEKEDLLGLPSEDSN